MKKIAFLGSKGIGYFTLEYLVSNAQKLEIQIVAVLSNDRTITPSEKSILNFAQLNHLPILHHLDDLLKIGDFDYLFSIQYHEILTQKHIDCARILAINLHLAPLPDYRGCNQFSFAILDGALEFGVTLHVLDAGIDSGDILFEKRFPISSTVTVSELHQRTTEESKQLLLDSIPQILYGNYKRTPQIEWYHLRPHHFHLRDEVNHIKQIDLSWSEEKIDRHIRATYFPPFTPPYCLVEGKKIELSPNWRSEIHR